MDWNYLVFVGIFFMLIIGLLLISFGDPRYAFNSDITCEEKFIANAVSRENHCESAPHQRMPTPPPHITRGLQRAPSLHSPYPKNLPPLGFEITTVTKSSDTTNVSSDTLPYPLGEISAMPHPTNFPMFIARPPFPRPRPGVPEPPIPHPTRITPKPDPPHPPQPRLPHPSPTPPPSHLPDSSPVPTLPVNELAYIEDQIVTDITNSPSIKNETEDSHTSEHLSSYSEITLTDSLVRNRFKN